MNKLLAALIATAFVTTGYAADAKKEEHKPAPAAAAHPAKKEEAKPAAAPAAKKEEKKEAKKEEAKK